MVTNKEKILARDAFQIRWKLERYFGAFFPSHHIYVHAVAAETVNRILLPTNSVVDQDVLERVRNVQ